MLIIPIESPDHQHDALVIVLGDDSLARMAAGDPAEVQCKKTGRTLVNPTVLVCHEKDSPEFTRLLQTRDIAAILNHLQRGWAFRPDRGDNDGPYQPAAARN